jgi:hypothetical protein
MVAAVMSSVICAAPCALMLQQVGDWAVALATARAQQLRQDSINKSSTCSTSSTYSPPSHPGATQLQAADSCCYSDIIGPASGVAVQLAAMYPGSSSISQVNSSVWQV